ncbi:MAG: protein kinase, partial [Vicinamibacteria bacterium]
MSLPSGTRLGPYEVTAAIGAGGMGEVYRGRDATLNRDVAIKVLPTALADDAERLARFKREAQVLASLNHSNISHVYGFEAASLPDGSAIHFLAMELVEGEDLSERLRRGAIPVEEAIAIAKQIALGLEEAHERGIIHRDLKPANVKLTPGGKVKILDFGLAKALEGDASNSASDSRLANSPTISRHMTEAGMIMGTAAYMSPEQARGKAVDKRADILSFGVVVFEMLTGRRLFAGETVSDTLAAVLKTDPDWSLLPRDAPKALRLLLKRCLDRDPQNRWHDIADARILIDADQASDPLDRARPAPPGLTRRVALAAAAALVLITIVAGLGGYSLSRQGRTTPNPFHLAIQLAANQELGIGGNSLPAFSPDGRILVFPGRQDGKDTLLRRDLGSRESVPIEGTEDGTDPFFSPDGHWLGFVAGGRLRKISTDGGRPFPLAEAQSSGGSAWLDDGTIIYTPIYSSGLYRVSAEGGSPEALTTPDHASGELGHWMPSPLPGGRFVVFTAFRSPLDRSRVGVLDVKTRAVRWLVDGGFFGRYASSGHLLFGKGTRLYAMPFDPKTATPIGPAVPVLDDILVSQTSGFAHVAVSSQGTLAYITQSLGDPLRELIWLDRTGREAKASTEHRRYMSASISPDGGRAALAIQGESQDLWTLSLDRGTLSRLTNGEATEYGPVWSKDGREIFYVVDRPPYE